MLGTSAFSPKEPGFSLEARVDALKMENEECNKTIMQVIFHHTELLSKLAIVDPWKNRPQTITAGRNLRSRQLLVKTES
jgi:hypothetical protein